MCFYWTDDNSYYFCCRFVLLSLEQNGENCKQLKKRLLFWINQVISIVLFVTTLSHFDSRVHYTCELAQ